MFPTFAHIVLIVRYFTHIFICLSFLGTAFAQDSVKFFAPSPELNRTRFVAVVGAQIAGYGGSLGFLSSAWYRDYDQTPFHPFDDSREWLQMDKAGHFTTGFYLARIGIDMYEWTGTEKWKATLYGGAGSLLYMTGIELLDGYSDGWGFSWGDMAANWLGTSFIMGRKMSMYKGMNSRYHRIVRGISFKFSFHKTGWAEMRPSLLGNTLSENILKDYNGQSYWMSFNLSAFMNKESKFPKWLNVAFGYGGEGMISGHPEFVTLASGNTIWVERHRQYYISLDIDLTEIKTRSHFLKTVFETISFIKIPAPALEMSRKGMKFHPFYY